MDNKSLLMKKLVDKMFLLILVFSMSSLQSDPQAGCMMNGQWQSLQTRMSIIKLWKGKETNMHAIEP